MAGIFPSAANNGQTPASSPNGYTPLVAPLNTVALYFGNNCRTVLSSENVNSLIGEIACAVSSAGIAYNAASTCNLYTAIVAVSANAVSGAVTPAALCSLLYSGAVADPRPNTNPDIRLHGTDIGEPGCVGLKFLVGDFSDVGGTGVGGDVAGRSKILTGSSISPLLRYDAFNKIYGMGYKAANNSIGAEVDGVGFSAAEFNLGSRVSAIGYAAGIRNSGNNVSLGGYLSGSDNEGTFCSIFGTSAGQTNKGTFCSIFGSGAGQGNTGNNSTIVGTQAGQANTGVNATIVGNQAGTNNTGLNSVMLGHVAGRLNTSARATLVGVASGEFNVGENLSSVGFASGQFNTGVNVTNLGFASGQCNTGVDVTNLGHLAGQYNTGQSASLVGTLAGQLNTGLDTSFFGFASGAWNTGNTVSFGGYFSGIANSANNVSGFGNFAGYGPFSVLELGISATYLSPLAVTISPPTAAVVGSIVSFFIPGGGVSGPVAVTRNYTVTSPTQLTIYGLPASAAATTAFVPGTSAGCTITQVISWSNNSYFGNNSIGTGPNQAVLGSPFQTPCGWSAFTVISDERQKIIQTDYDTSVRGLSVIGSIRPVLYRMNPESRYTAFDPVSKQPVISPNDGSLADPRPTFGFTAQNVRAAGAVAGLCADECGVRDMTMQEGPGDTLLLDTTAIIADLVLAVQQLAARIAELEAPAPLTKKAATR